MKKWTCQGWHHDDKCPSKTRSTNEIGKHEVESITTTINNNNYGELQHTIIGTGTTITTTAHQWSRPCSHQDQTWHRPGSWLWSWGQLHPMSRASWRQTCSTANTCPELRKMCFCVMWSRNTNEDVWFRMRHFKAFIQKFRDNQSNKQTNMPITRKLNISINHTLPKQHTMKKQCGTYPDEEWSESALLKYAHERCWKSFNLCDWHLVDFTTLLPYIAALNGLELKVPRYPSVDQNLHKETCVSMRVCVCVFVKTCVAKRQTKWHEVDMKTRKGEREGRWVIQRRVVQRWMNMRSDESPQMKLPFFSPQWTGFSV